MTDADALIRAITEAADLLRDAYGHADAPYQPAALQALAVLNEALKLGWEPPGGTPEGEQG